MNLKKGDKISFLILHFRKYRTRMAIAFIMMTIACIADNYNKYVIKLLVDSAQNNNSSAKYVFMFVGILIINDLLFKFGWFIFYKIPKNFAADIQTACYDYVQKHSFGYLENNSTGEITKKINTIGESAGLIVEAFDVSFIYFLGFAGLLLFIHPYLFFVCLIFSVIYISLSYYFSKKIKKKEQNGQLISEQYNSQLVDTLLNLFAIKSFAREVFFKNKIDVKSHQWSTTQSHIQQYKMYPISVTLAWVSASYTLTTGLVLIYLESKNLITIGDFIAVLPQSVTIMSFLRNSMFSLMNVFGNFGKIEQAYQIIEDLHDINDAKNAKELTVTNGEIIFKNVTFAYKSNPKHKIFENFNLHIKKEERRIGVVGSSGCGKSTLVKLIARFYDVNEGSILIDGQNIQNVTQESLHKAMSFIPQDINLFNDTILNNIKYGKDDATDAEVEKAIKYSNIDNFINEFEEKYNFTVGERGVKLSGGQRQRIAIARAILKNAPILILDEATSALDNNTEQWIEEAMENLIKINPNMTIIAIAHRLSTIKHMDRIVVMESGLVAEDGSFEELVSKEGGKFKELWEHQVNGMVV